MPTANGFIASGSINPCRFVALVAATVGCVEQATASKRHFGVSQKGTYYAPGSAADTGLAGVDTKPLTIHQEGEIALLKIGGTVTHGDLLTSDASGQGVSAAASTALQYFGGIALQSGTTGQFINIRIRPFEAATA
jgi:hypothetical protein